MTVVTQSAASTTEPVSRYVPPMRRKQLEEQRFIEPESNNKTYLSNYSSSQNYNRSNIFQHLRGNNPKSDTEQYRNFYSNDGNNRNRISTTGTNWDIRDNRRWQPEKESDIFDDKQDRPAKINFNSYDAIPVELSGEGSKGLSPLISFKETTGVHALLQENIIRVDYVKPTPVQKYSISVIMAGRDLMACAQTGSGKTAAFLFPIITKMLNTGPPCPVARTNFKVYSTYPVALILSPTRELAVQIYKESRKFTFHTGVKTVVVYGGSDFKTQNMSLREGCDICVATPGRLSEFTERGIVSLNLVKYFVLDEADRMLDMGFAPQINAIVKKLPTSSDGRQTIMFSATFPNQIQKLAGEFLKNYIFLTVGRVGSTNDFITQNFIYANETNKPKRLLNVLEESKNGLVLVFVETKKKADLIESYLVASGFPAVSLHGDKSQTDRERALDAFRTGEKSILVATDVAARGLDIHNIEHVINCDLPARIEDYVHRIGRTGRAGNRGKATSFVNEQNKPVLRDLLALLEESQQEIPSWFFDLVKSCTSSYRGFNNPSSLPMFGKFMNSRSTPHRQGFGGKDMRSSNRIANSSTNNLLQRNAQDTYYRNQTSMRCEDEEDGW